ncbi:MAG: response regulator [Nitrospira sp.]
MAEGRPAVLVVEDDGEMRSLLRDGLWNEGYSLCEALDGNQAVLSIVRTVPDLILTEIRFSAGGLDYIARLRALVPSCPIIVMTAFGDETVKVDVMRAGATVYFSKPLHLAELKVCIKRLLGVDRQIVS